MSFPTLAEHVVEILAQRARMTIDAPHHRAADTLFDAVIGRLRRTGTAGTFDLFAAEPDAPARRRPLVGVLNHQFRDDPQFRDLIAGMVRATNIAPPAGSEPVDEPSGFNRRRMAVIVVSVLAATGLIIGGRVAYLHLTEEPQPDGNTSCRDFFAMHPDKQRALLEHVYRQRNEPLREHDPYIVASVLYGCGQNPERTVIQVVNSSA
ncbi:hypothetical protein [Actinokineospora xionganensis]|uniref:DUF732 domain-containing protein n=1 Tax=Actinokineospora xionganensis TaxID=2684470 RepID=A0ABR7L3I5_9PSEU|nr:hypothetical protein [Actinokineospora xionganensis]MBC6447251.1 hypothetical protein [Actinokineospora xionganensis]